MQFLSAAVLCILINAALSSPTTSDDFNDSDYDVQNDNDNYGNNYDDGEEDPDVEDNKSNVPLKITTLDQEFVKDIGDTVLLPCEITGANYVQVWRKKNENAKDSVLFQAAIRMAATENMKILDNGSLEISNLHVQDAGTFECSAMGSDDNVPKIQHEVLLNVPPKIESLTVKDNITLLKNGDTLELTCKAKGYPKPTISWHKGSTRFDIQGEVFTVQSVKHRDAGVYKCLADNKIGEPAFDHIYIRVEAAPVITIEKITVSSENNTETELECIVHAEPRAQVVWTKDGLNIVNTERVQLVNHEHRHNLILKDVQSSDFGEYTCQATNVLGTSKRNIRLVPTPAIYGLKKSADAKDVVLTWSVQSKTNLTEHQVLYRLKGEDEWKMGQARGDPEVRASGNGVYDVKYMFSRGLGPGEYEVKLRSKNHRGWSDYTEPITVDVEAKHGHHKSHKKNHNKGKEPEVPAEHQEGESDFVKDPSSRDSRTSASSTIFPQLLLLFTTFFAQQIKLLRI